MNDYLKIKQTIIDYEENKINIDNSLIIINKISSLKVQKSDLTNYWKHSSLDDFVNTLLVSPIENWESIDDKKALILIKEILNNFSNDAIILKNSEALEKKFKKPSGYVSDCVFIENISDPDKILKKLKEQDVLFL